MGDIRDWGKFRRGRWDWTGYGYEDGFPRGCQFTDMDAGVEFDERMLTIECKHYDGTGMLPGEGYPPGVKTGQLRYLRNEARLGKVVFLLYGDATANDPYVLYILGADRSGDRFEDWRGLPQDERRKRLKYEIDRAMGLLGPAASGAA